MWKQLFNTKLPVVVGLRSVVQPHQQMINLSLLETLSPTSNQCRTTFILKRKWPPGLHKKNQRSRKLNARHFVYDLVEDTNVKRKEDIKLILTTYVEGLGHQGDHISVRPNFGYNKLLLPGLAVYPTPENIEKYSKLKASNKEESEKHSSPYAQRTVEVLSRLVVAVVMNKETPWQVEPWHIRASFRKAGVHLPTEAIQLPEKPITGPDLSLEAKSFYVTVTVNNLEKVQVQCRIHHWSTMLSDRLPFIQDHWKLPAEQLFPESPPTSQPDTTVTN